MSSSKILALGVCSVFAVACGGGVSLGSVPSGLNGGDDGGNGGAGSDGSPGAAGPYDISCTMYLQPATSNQEQTFTVRSDADATKTITFPGYTIDVAFSHAASTPSEGTLSISVREKGSVQRFPLSRDVAPVEQFAGGHGFTGLVYVGADVQYICKASGAPTVSGDPSGAAAPFRVGCLAEVKSTVDGKVERSETFELSRADTRTLDLGDFGLHAQIWDDAFEGRSMILSSWKKPAGQDNYTLRQLFQFDRTAPIVNHLPGNTFTGRTSLGVGTDRELTYSCDSR